MKEVKYKFTTIIRGYGIFKFSPIPISEISQSHYDISELSDSDIDKILNEGNIQNGQLIISSLSRVKSG